MIIKTKEIKGSINPTYQNLALILKGEAYYQLHDYNSAKSYIANFIKVALKYNSYHNLMYAYHLMADIYEKSNNYAISLRYFKKYIQLRDSIETQKVIQNVNEQELKYKTAEKDKELAIKQLNIAKQELSIKRKNLLIAGITTGTVLLGLLSIALLLYNKQKEKLHTRKLFILNQEKEIADKEQQIVKLKGLIEGEEKERIRIAQDLHDGIVVQFATAKMTMSTLPDYYPKLTNLAQFNLSVTQLNNAIKELRKTAHHLLPDILLEEGLTDAIYYLALLN